MYVENYPPKRTFDMCERVSCPKDGMSGMVMKIFGKKCSIWLSGVPISEKQVSITYQMKDLVPKGHPDYKYNYASWDTYKHKKNTGKK